MPVTDDFQARLDSEEVHLMYHANNQVRRWLQAQPSDRTRRLTLLTRAVQEQFGSEARHVRRMVVVLQGLQMIGGGDNNTGVMTNGTESWLAEAVDELMLASRETVEIDVEGTWEQELLTLRRWLAHDYLAPDRGETDGDARSSIDARPLKKTDEEMEDDDEVTEEDRTSLMQQRRRPPWRRPHRSRSRGERPTPTSRQAREQEAADLRSNSHRPWRVSSSSSRALTSPARAAARPRLVFEPGTPRWWTRARGQRTLASTRGTASLTCGTR